MCNPSVAGPVSARITLICVFTRVCLCDQIDYSSGGAPVAMTFRFVSDRDGMSGGGGVSVSAGLESVRHLPPAMASPPVSQYPAHLSYFPPPSPHYPPPHATVAAWPPLPYSRAFPPSFAPAPPTFAPAPPAPSSHLYVDTGLGYGMGHPSMMEAHDYRPSGDSSS